MSIILKNRDLMGASQAIEEIAARRYDDEKFNLRIAKTRKLLREQRDEVAERQQKIYADCALIGPDGKPVTREQDGQIVQDIDPTLLDVFNERNKALLSETIELPYSFTLAEIKQGKERIGSAAKGFQIVKWIVEPWIYDALGPLLILPEDEASPKLVEDEEEE